MLRTIKRAGVARDFAALRETFTRSTKAAMIWSGVRIARVSMARLTEAPRVRLILEMRSCSSVKDCGFPATSFVREVEIRAEAFALLMASFFASTFVVRSAATFFERRRR
ncbi:MAG: hypothetical protein IPG73_13590 [Ignavibacteria bacterium]|nr:hypothetical protein [Ignavibacteria bacterium]